MKKYSRIKTVSYLKANADEIVRSLGEGGEPLVITQNGKAKAVLQDIKSYEQTQETMALLKIRALRNDQIDAGEVEPAADVVKRMRESAKRLAELGGSEKSLRPVRRRKIQ